MCIRDRYGTPAESTTYTFARALKKRFGIVEGITDKDYLTNSYHVNVKEHIDAFDKLQVEAKFQKVSSGGAISYVAVSYTHLVIYIRYLNKKLLF